MKYKIAPERAAQCFDDQGLFIGADSADEALAQGDRTQARLLLMLSKLMLEQRVRNACAYPDGEAKAEVLAYLEECRGEVLRRLESV